MFDSVALASALLAVIFVSVVLSSRKPTQRSTFQSAFGTTAMALLCFVTGVLGLRIGTQDLSVHVTHTGWMRWWDLRAGAVLSVIALHFWRKALRSLA